MLCELIKFFKTNIAYEKESQTCFFFIYVGIEHDTREITILTHFVQPT